MASIALKTKNGKAISYKIRVCVGRNAEAKQEFRCTTWKISDGVFTSKDERMVQKFAKEWETKVKWEFLQNIKNC